MSDAITRALGAEEKPKDLAVIDSQVATVTDVTKSLTDAKKENQNADYEVARSNLKSVIKDSMSLMPDLINLTREAYSDKMYKAASEFFKTIADLNVSLVELSETKDVTSNAKKKEVTPEEPKKGTTNVFIGTTEEMLDRISSSKEVNA